MKNEEIDISHRFQEIWPCWVFWFLHLRTRTRRRRECLDNLTNPQTGIRQVARSPFCTLHRFMIIMIMIISSWPSSSPLWRPWCSPLDPKLAVCLRTDSHQGRLHVFSTLNILIVRIAHYFLWQFWSASNGDQCCDIIWYHLGQYGDNSTFCSERFEQRLKLNKN